MMILKFGELSKKHLNQVHPDLKAVAELALSWGIMDFTVYESVREKSKQNRLYDLGKSKVKWPDSKHNVLHPEDLSDAFDVAPYINGAISWDNHHCVFLGGLLSAAAAILGVNFRWGGDWNQNGTPVTDQDFDDLVHYEKVE